jgi:hypothetical protein
MSFNLVHQNNTINNLGLVNILLDSEIPNKSFIKTYDTQTNVIDTEFNDISFEFVFDNLFTYKDTFDSIFTSSIQNIIDSAINGQNSLILSYGNSKNIDFSDSVLLKIFQYILTQVNTTDLECSASNQINLENPEEIDFQAITWNACYSNFFHSYSQRYSLYILKISRSDNDSVTYLYIINLFPNGHEEYQETLYASNGQSTDLDYENLINYKLLSLVSSYLEVSVNKSIFITISPENYRYQETLTSLFMASSFIIPESYQQFIHNNEMTERLNTEVDKLIDNCSKFENLCDDLFSEGDKNKNIIDNLQSQVETDDIIKAFEEKALRKFNEIEQFYKQTIRKNDKKYQDNIEKFFKELSDRDSRIIILEQENRKLKEEMEKMRRSNEREGYEIKIKFGDNIINELYLENRKLEKSLVIKGNTY